MLVNSSSISKDFVAFQCTVSKLSIFILTCFNGMKVLLLLPVLSYIIYLGHQKWQRHRSFKTTSPSDLLMYHLTAMEIIGFPGHFLFHSGIYTHNSVVIIVGMFMSFITFYAELFFNLLTCVERYLAVVHPITYRGLKNNRRMRIRNITIGCIWVLCFGMTAMNRVIPLMYEAVINFSFVVSSILVISFCSISVLCVLFHPGPREGGQEKYGLDKSKVKAFYTITVISSVVWLWFLVLLIDSALVHSTLGDSVKCLIMVSIGCLNLPCSLVSPLLYLHKDRKLFCCRAK